MVGVPGRSKACHTCKQRRIRCNGEKPQCSNCTKSMRLCGGYLRNHVFVLSENMTLEPAVSHGSSSNSETGSLMVARWRVDPANPSQPAAVLKIASIRLQHQHGASLPNQISARHAGQQQILDVFLRQHLPSDALNHAGPITSQRHWLLEIQDAPSMGPALEYSVLALCMAKLGRKFDDENLVHGGLSMYTKGLRALRMAVRNPNTRSDDETLAACLALGVFESAQRPDWPIDDFVAHYRGAVGLLLLRPPEAYISGLSHCIFEELRIQSVFMGMHLRYKTPLADSRWRDIPWKPAQKGLRDDLIDVLLDIPEVYRRLDGLGREASPSKILSEIVETIELCWRSDSQLSHWYDNFRALVSGPIYWPTLSSTDSPVDDIESGKVFPVAFQFQSYDVAHTMILYWIGHLLIHPIMCLLYDRLGGLNTIAREHKECLCEKIGTVSRSTTRFKSTICVRHLAKTLAPLEYRTRWDRGAASNICQSAEFVLQENMGDLGQYIFLARILVVREFLVHALGDWSRELDWIAHLITKIQS